MFHHVAIEELRSMLAVHLACTTPAAHSLSLIEAVVGIMYVATMIARFVSIQTSNVSRNDETSLK